VRTFQNIRLFPKMTVLENLIVAQHNVLQRASKFSIAGLFKLPGYRKAEREAIERAAMSCPVFLSLHPEIEKDVHFSWNA